MGCVQAQLIAQALYPQVVADVVEFFVNAPANKQKNISFVRQIKKTNRMYGGF